MRYINVRHLLTYLQAMCLISPLLIFIARQHPMHAQHSSVCRTRGRVSHMYHDLFHLHTFQQCTEIMRLATTEVEIWQRDVSYTISSWLRPASCIIASSHSGDILNAIPCSSVGTCLENSSFRIATVLRLGEPICTPINASAEKTSTNMVYMVCRAGGLLVVIRDTASSMIS